MSTQELILAYLMNGYVKETWTDIEINDYDLNGSIIKVHYSYNPNYEWQTEKNYISSGSTLEINLLDYITFIHLQK